MYYNNKIGKKRLLGVDSFYIFFFVTNLRIQSAILVSS